jgi:hypothetical protein
MTKINRKQNLLARIAQVNRQGLPYKVESGNGLKKHGTLEPYQILKDGKVEVLAGMSEDFPFCGWGNDVYGGTRGGSLMYEFKEKYAKLFNLPRVEKVWNGDIYTGNVYCNCNSPLDIHAIYDKDTDQTHFFLMKEEKKKKRKITRS